MDERKGWTVNDVVTVIGAIFSGFALLISTWNNHKIGDVQTQQVMQVQKAEVISSELEATKKETTNKLNKIEKTTENVESRIMKMP